MKTLKEAKQKNDQEKLIDSFLKEIGVKFEVFPAGVGLERDGWECDGWNIVLKGLKGTESFEFFTGIRHRTDHGQGYKFLPKESRDSLSFNEYKKRWVKPFPPYAASVLYCLALDASAAHQSFEEWCSDFGYDNDSIKALESYRDCCKNAAKLLKIFTSEQLKKISEILEDY